MTIGEAIKTVQTIKQTPLPRAQLVRWLEEVDRTVMRELVHTHKFGHGLVFDGYDPDGETGADTVLLLVPAPYDRLYIYYLCAQIDMQNQEFDLYQNNAALYNLAWNDYAAYYNRQILPRREPRFNAWGTKASACHPLIRPHCVRPPSPEGEGCPSSVCAARRHLPPEGEGKEEGDMPCCCRN